MIRNYVLQRCNAPGTNSNVLLGPAQTDRLTWSQAYSDGSPAFYFLDDGTQAEWGVGTFHVGSPATVSRDTVIGNTVANTNRLNFTGQVDLYNEIPGERMPFINGGILSAPNARLDTHAGGVPIGASMDYYGSALPAGWLWTNGASISRTTYAQLFAVIGTAYGTADAASFNLPNRCEVPTIGRGGMNGAAPRGIVSAFPGYTTLGTVIGSSSLQQHSHVLTVLDGPGNAGHGHVVFDNGHVHSISDPGHNHVYQYVAILGGSLLGVASPALTPSNQSLPTTTALTGITQTNTAATGIAVLSHKADITVTMAPAGTGAAENIQPSLVCNNIIYCGSAP